MNRSNFAAVRYVSIHLMTCGMFFRFIQKLHSFHIVSASDEVFNHLNLAVGQIEHYLLFNFFNIQAFDKKQKKISWYKHVVSLQKMSFLEDIKKVFFFSLCKTKLISMHFENLKNMWIKYQLQNTIQQPKYQIPPTTTEPTYISSYQGKGNCLQVKPHIWSHGKKDSQSQRGP